ncbi:hypothetical protein GCM10009564_02560 [Streptomyces thermogriseus]|uniref:ABC transporter substrate-binding protein n=2 Tax=Streptomyces TaxID=1883 RepID=A0ABN1SS21_9ACTN
MFNCTEPGGTTPDHSIPDGLAGFVDRAAPGSTVRMGMHWYGPAGPKTGMPEAQDREVALRMVPEKRDESIGTPFTAAGPRGGSPWTWCTSGCPGDGPDDADAVDQVKHAGDKLRATCGRTTDAFADKGGQGQARTGKAHGARGHPPSTARTRPARSGPSASRDAGFGGRTAPSSWDWFGVLKHFLIIGAHCSLTGAPLKTFLGRRTRVLAATTATAGMILLAACTSTDGGGDGSATAPGGVELVKAGRLTTCTHLPYPPFQSEIDGKVQGFDVALIDLVAEDLGVKQEILDTPFENFKTGAFLNSGKCDLAAAGMTITEERKKNVDFSDPYFRAAQAVLVAKDSGITSLADVKARKARLGAQAQTTGEDYVKGQGFDPVSFESSDAVLNGLRTGQVKAVVIDYPVVQGWLKDKANAEAFRLAEQIDTGEEYGFTVKKGNTALREAVNKALADARADGTYKKLYEQWIGPYDESAASPAAS